MYKVLRSKIVQSNLYLVGHEGVFALPQSCYEALPRHLHPLPCQPLPQNLHCHLLQSSLMIASDNLHLVPETVLEEKCPESIDLGCNSGR